MVFATGLLLLQSGAPTIIRLWKFRFSSTRGISVFLPQFLFYFLHCTRFLSVKLAVAAAVTVYHSSVLSSPALRERWTKCTLVMLSLSE